MREDRLDPGGAADIAANNLGNGLLLPPQNLGNDPQLQAGGIEPGRRRAAQVMELQIYVAPADFGAVERAAEAGDLPGAACAVGEDGGRALRNGRQDGAQVAVEPDYGLALVLTFLSVSRWRRRRRATDITSAGRRAEPV